MRALGLVVAGAVGALLLTACGEAQPGVAASIEGDTITVDQVHEQTDEFFEAYPNFEGQVDPALVNSIQIENFLRARIVDLTAADLGIEPTKADLDEFVEQFGGIEQVTQQTSNGGVPPDPELVQAEIRSAWLQFAIGRELAEDPSDDEQVSIASREATDAKAAEVQVTVNPRFGTWDGSRVTPGNASLSVTNAPTEGQIIPPPG